MFELKEYYTLDEALKLYALWKRDNDVQAQYAEEMQRERHR